MSREEHRLLAELGYKRLRPGWAKLELFLGLSAAGVGVWLLGADATLLNLIGGVLFVLGSYLAMAGHRSHLYQSQTKLIAYVMRRLS